MSTFLVVVVTMALLVFLNGLYVAAEFSTVAARRTRVSQMAASGNRLARALLAIMEDGEKLDRYVAACQLGITATSLVLGAYGQRVVAPQLVGPATSLFIALDPILQTVGLEATTLAGPAAISITTTVVLLLFTTLQVVLGELFPKSVSLQYPEQIALAVVTPMRWSMVILRPFINVFNGSGNILLRLMGRNTADSHALHAHSPAEIEYLVTESHEGGLLNQDEQQMLRNAFRLRDLTAQQVMVHRTRLVAMPRDSSIEQILGAAIDVGYTRLPIYQGSIDNIVGFVHIKDVYRLFVRGETRINEILRKVERVPESLPVVDVWENLRNKRQYVAIVFDEYGGTAGMITFEDLIEEIFGELQDEFDNESAVVSESDGRIHLRGDLLVSDVNEYFDLNLPEDVAVTLSGLVISQLGRSPKVGDCIMLAEVQLCVEEMADLGIAAVSLPRTDGNDSIRIREWEVGLND